jgi:hypothetical protein
VIDVDDEAEAASEAEEAELGKLLSSTAEDQTYPHKPEHMMKHWTAPVYAFYHPIPDIEYVDGRRAHVFQCTPKSCSYKCRRFLDGPDHSSTGNLIKHVKSCWGDAVYEAATNCQNANDARESIVKPLVKTGTITVAFDQKGKGKVTYRHRQHTKMETK